MNLFLKKERKGYSVKLKIFISRNDINGLRSKAVDTNEHRGTLYHRIPYRTRRSEMSADASSRCKTWVQPKWKPFTKTSERATVCVTAWLLGHSGCLSQQPWRTWSGLNTARNLGWLMAASSPSWTLQSSKKPTQPTVLGDRGNISTLQTSLRKEWDSHWGTQPLQLARMQNSLQGDLIFSP